MTAGLMDQWDGRNWELRLAIRAARRSREQGLRSGRRDRASQLVAAARVLAENSDLQFTVEQVAARAGTTIQTLYRHFGSKEELLLAVIEENIAEGTATLEVEIEDISDPLDRLRAIIKRTIVSASVTTGSYARLRFHARERPRLAELFPEAAAAVDAPFRRLVVDGLERAVEAGAIVSADLERDADVIVCLTTGYSHAVGTQLLPWDGVEIADYVTEFCLTALTGGSTGRENVNQ